jgi:dienelactone hydrolase
MAIVATACAAGAAQVKTESLTYRVGDKTMIGYLARPADAAGLRPGIVVVHEWMGLNAYAKRRAEQLAELGYVALAADMYGDGKVARDVPEAQKLSGEVKQDRPEMRRRAAAALAALKAVKGVDPARVAAIGYCFGGTTVLELARSGADVRGVVSFHGALDTPMPAAPKAVRAAVLACHGADDPYVPAKDVVAFEDEMRKAGAEWQLIKYGGAVHSFTNPDSGSDPSKGVAYNAAADRRSWAAMQAFFLELFGTIQ